MKAWFSSRGRGSPAASLGLLAVLLAAGATSVSASREGCFGGLTADGFEQYIRVFEGVVLEGKRSLYPDENAQMGPGYWSYSVQVLRSWRGMPALGDASWAAGTDPRPGVVTVVAWDAEGGPSDGDDDGGVASGVPLVFYAAPESGYAFKPGGQLSTPGCGGIVWSTEKVRCILDRVSAPENADTRPPLVDTSACDELPATA